MSLFIRVRRFCLSRRIMPITMLKRQIRQMADLKSLFILNMLCLCVNLFLLTVKLTGTGLWPDESFFPKALEGKDKALLFDTLKALTDACDKRNVTYFLYSGSILGSYRHHGLIPWDDDVDIMFNATQKHQVQRVLGSMTPHYHLYSQTPDLYNTAGTWKFYSAKAKGYVHKPFSWPYMDIFFFRENRTHIWDEIPKYGEAFTKRKEWIFPLQKRPFGPLEVKAPCNIEKSMELVFDHEICQSPHFNHWIELPAFSFSKKSVPCGRLANSFPFVEHKRMADGRYNETLSMAGYILQTKIVPRCPGR